MEVQQCALDIVGGAAVMVNDGHTARGGKQLFGFHLIRAVGIHHHQQGILVQLHQRILGSDEAVLILGHGLELLQQGF